MTNFLNCGDEYADVLGALGRVSRDGTHARLQKTIGDIQQSLVKVPRVVGMKRVDVLARSEPAMMRPGELLAKAMEAARAGRISWHEAVQVETAVHAGLLPDNEGMARILGASV